jgi:hypothetical protein
MPDRVNAKENKPGVPEGEKAPQARSSELVMDLTPLDLKLGDTIKVLVSLVFPTDKKEGATPAAQVAIQKTWAEVARFYSEASFGRKKIEATVTGWRPLTGDSTLYITNKKEEAGPNIKDDHGTLMRLCSEAAQAALDQGYRLEDYRILVAVIFLDGNRENGKSMGVVRGFSDRSAYRFKCADPAIDIDPGGDPMGIIAVDEQADWARCAHELGHFLVVAPTRPENPSAPAAFDAEDLYDDREGCADSSAAGFDLMGFCPDRPLFSGFHMELLGFFPGEKIRTILWDSETYSAEYNVAAHVAPSEMPGGDDWYHLLKICVSDSLMYYVETRQRSPGRAVQTFDPSIEIGDIDLAHPFDDITGGVLVTRVLKGVPSTSQQMRYITVKHDPCPGALAGHVEPHTLRGGQKASDLASGLTIEVLGSPLNDRPLVHRVRVSWDKNKALGLLSLGSLPQNPGKPKVPASNPYSYNLYLRQASDTDEAWECPDIWIEREPFHDNPGDHPWDYGWDEQEGRPWYSGDRPVPLLRHRVWARVRCDEDLIRKAGTPPEVGDVLVGLYDLLPPYRGVPIQICATACTVKKGGYTDVALPGPGRDVFWMPASTDTVWIVVDVNRERLADERDSCDNTGKLVVYDYECLYTLQETPDKEMPPEPLPIKVPVYNPSTDRGNTIWLGVEVGSGADRGPGEMASGAFVVDFPTCVPLGPGEKKDVFLTVQPSDNYLSQLSVDAQYTRVRVLQYLLDPSGQSQGTGSVSRSPIRGLTYWITLKQAVKLSLATDPAGSGPYRVAMTGGITPPTGGKEKCYVEVTGKDGIKACIQLVEIGPDGRFHTFLENLKPGTYHAQASIKCSRYAARADSELIGLNIGDGGEIMP